MAAIGRITESVDRHGRVDVTGKDITAAVKAGATPHQILMELLDICGGATSYGMEGGLMRGPTPPPQKKPQPRKRQPGKAAKRTRSRPVADQVEVWA